MRRPGAAALTAAVLATAAGAAAAGCWPSGHDLGRLSRPGRRQPGRAGAGARTGRLWVLAGWSVPVGFIGFGVLAGLCWVIMLVTGWWAWRRRSRSALATANRRAVSGFTAALADGLRAGRSPADATWAAAAVAGPLAGPLRSVAVTARLGGDPAELLRRLSRRPGAAGLAAVAAVWQLVGRVGARPGPLLAAVAAGLADEEDARREAAVALAGPRQSGRVLAALPAFGIGLAVALGADPGRLLLHSLVGGGLLAGAAGFTLAGLVWTERITRRVLPGPPG